MNYIINLFKTVVKNIFTGMDNITYDPARVVGYGTGIVGVLSFAADSIVHLVQKGALDASSFGIEFAALSAGLTGIAAGVAIKSNAEPTATVTTTISQ